MDHYGDRVVTLTPEGHACAEQALGDLGLQPRSMRVGPPSERRRVISAGARPAGPTGPHARAATLSSSALV